MGVVLGELLPLSLAIALNPIPILAIMLTFRAPNARALSAAFMAGWVAGIALAMLATTLLSSLLPERDPDEPAPVVGTILIVLGAVLVYLAYWQWRKRPGKDEEAPLPGWMSSITTMRVSRGLGLGFLLSALNFKHILIAGAAGVVIGAADLSTGGAVLAYILFVLIASSSATLPVLAHRVMGSAFDERMDEAYHWLVANNATILAVLLLVIGVSVIGQGIGSF